MLNFPILKLGQPFATARFLEREVGVKFSPSELLLHGSADQKYHVLSDRIRKKLQAKGIVGTTEEAAEMFQRTFGISTYSAPELIRSAPGGRTEFDPKTQKVKILFNPFLEVYSSKPYQLFTVLEEGIHAYHFANRKTAPDMVQEEVAVKDTLLRVVNLFNYDSRWEALLRSKGGKENVEASMRFIENRRV